MISAIIGLIGVSVAIYVMFGGRFPDPDQTIIVSHSPFEK